MISGTEKHSGNKVPLARTDAVKTVLETAQRVADKGRSTPFQQRQGDDILEYLF